MKNADNYLAKILKENSMRRDLEKRLNLEPLKAMSSMPSSATTKGLALDRNKQALKDIEAEAVAKPKSGKMAKIIITDLAIGAISFLGF